MLLSRYDKIANLTQKELQMNKLPLRKPNIAMNVLNTKVSS